MSYISVLYAGPKCLCSAETMGRSILGFAAVTATRATPFFYYVWTCHGGNSCLLFLSCRPFFYYYTNNLNSSMEFTFVLIVVLLFFFFYLNCNNHLKSLKSSGQLQTSEVLSQNYTYYSHFKGA